MLIILPRSVVWYVLSAPYAFMRFLPGNFKNFEYFFLRFGSNQNAYNFCVRMAALTIPFLFLLTLIQFNAPISRVTDDISEQPPLIQ